MTLPQVDIVATDSPEYVVLFQGEVISQHQQLHTAIEVAINFALRHPTETLKVSHQFEYRVTARGL